jgi:hypothetical protein
LLLILGSSSKLFFSIMIITSFANLLTRATKPRYDEDMVDRLNNRFVAYLFLAAGITIFTNNLGGSPVECWEKPNWHKSWTEYASDYCFVEGTYFAPLNGSLPDENGYGNLKKLSFYQWTPFVFTLLGVIFTLPRSLWSFINWSSSFHMTAILTEGSRSKKVSAPTPEFIKFSTGHIKDILTRRRFKNDSILIKRLWSKLFGLYYLTTWYILIKVLNIFCVLIALITISTVITDDNRSLFGIQAIMALTHGENWKKTGIFPRVTICRFRIREAGIYNSNYLSPKVTQCVLLTNMYIEKLFIVVWFGLWALLITNVINLLRFFWLLIPKNRQSFLYDLMMPALEYLFPDLDKDPKWPTKNRHNVQHIENKFKHLQNVKKQGILAEIEIAQQLHIEAIQTADEDKERALKKRADKRIKFSEYFQNDVDKFVEYLGADGYLTLRLLYANAGNFIAGATVAKLFWKFVKQQEKSHS